MSSSELPLEVTVQDVQSLRRDQANFILLDVREQLEYDTANIADSRLLPMSEIRQRIGELDPHRDDHIVVMCHHGARSLQVTEALRQLGFSHVQSMAGGIDQWSTEIDSSVPRY